MNPLIAHVPAAFAAGVATLGMAQTVWATLGVRRFMRGEPALAQVFPAVTVFKPLHGAEPLLHEALASFFVQDYPALQLIFGVHGADDPAAGVVRDLCALYPWVDAVLVVDATQHGANGKIANLINMYPVAKYDVLLISDSDMHVAPDYVRRVATCLLTPGTGLATSLYVGKPARPGLPTQMGAAYINQIFASGALMARALGRQDCLGATMALRRTTLQRIGGFQALADYVADDGVLGRLVLATGQLVRMAATVPATTVAEQSFAGLLSHELRWARTIRAMAPVGFILSAVQYPIFWAALAAVCAPRQDWPLLLLALACVLRAASGRLIERALGAAVTPMWLVPFRDMLSICMMVAAFFGEEVAWRGQVLSTAPDRALAQGAPRFAPPAVLAHEKRIER